eukprot:UN32843
MVVLQYIQWRILCHFNLHQIHINSQLHLPIHVHLLLEKKLPPFDKRVEIPNLNQPMQYPGPPFGAFPSGVDKYQLAEMNKNQYIPYQAPRRTPFIPEDLTKLYKPASPTSNQRPTTDPTMTAQSIPYRPPRRRPFVPTDLTKPASPTSRQPPTTGPPMTAQSIPYQGPP